MNLDVVSRTSPVGYGGAPFAVLLLSVGGPVQASEVRTFLDQRLLDQEPFSVGLILRAPFLRILNWMHNRTLHRRLLALPHPPGFRDALGRCAEGVEKRLRLRGRDATVRAACRYVEPSIEPVLVDLYAQGLRRMVLVFLHPQSSTATTVALSREFRRAMSQSGCVFRATALEAWYAHTAYLDLMASSLQEALEALPETERAATRVLFVADGTYDSDSEADVRYVEQIDATVQGIVARQAHPLTWGVGYHRGPGPQRWVEPGVLAAARQLVDGEARHLLCVPLATQETLDGLYDIDVELKREASRWGLESVQRVSCLDDHPAFLDLLAERIEHTLTAE